MRSRARKPKPYFAASWSLGKAGAIRAEKKRKRRTNEPTADSMAYRPAMFAPERQRRNREADAVAPFVEPRPERHRPLDIHRHSVAPATDSGSARRTDSPPHSA